MTDRVTFPIGYQLAFLVSFFGALPSLYFFGKVRIPPFRAASIQGDSRRSLRTRWREFSSPFLESPRFVRYNAAVALFRTCLALPVGLFSIYWVDYLHASDTWIGIRGSVGYASLVVGYWFWGRIAGRIGHRRLLFISLLIGFYPITTGLATSAVWLAPAAVVWGLFAAAIDIGTVDMLLVACPEGRQPSFVALANVLAAVELFIGPLLGAALAQIVGVPAALITSGVLQILSGVLFFLLPTRAQERQDHAALGPLTMVE
jgi:MFS family permease